MTAPPSREMAMRRYRFGFPDLSFNGRAGHYRIRVHYDWFKWKGLQGGGQRLLIMAFPGKGDKPVTYRKPPKR
ncbi:hypothetical protein [Streptosporangium sp. NPDC087985]|uniref:hypothetical protein n=1 Tax=Streptosporangium sp. NPDC087985 TaxID=3366196 RepID=UPI0037FA6183